MKRNKVELYCSIHALQRSIAATKLACAYDMDIPRKNNTILTDQSYQRLTKFKWLDDEILCQFTQNYSTLSSHFFRLVQNQNFPSALRWFNAQTQYFNKNYFNIIINQSNSHWYGVHVNLQFKIVLVSDSIGDGQNCISALRAFINENYYQIIINFNNFDAYQVLLRNGNIKYVKDYPYQIKGKIIQQSLEIIDLECSSDEQEIQDQDESSYRCQNNLQNKIDYQITYTQDSEIENQIYFNLPQIINFMKSQNDISQQIINLSCQLKNLQISSNNHIIDFIYIPQLEFKLQQLIEANFSNSELYFLKLCFYACYMPVQDNGFDCGVYTIAFILFCNQGNDEICGQNSSTWRKKIIQILTN
ncbi:Ulp1 protease family protein [Spironucleus salmonicida]|uniref:Ulp1 protease family protein n=1 Tax=Spironucleus salmonicida TaxID=348837 RepID=V6LW43_9EUKA|nr:Ulp1 protease family protein [Spironucleus salmonicida]|eukprot:EST45034.1 Ulp1 protease family protein [Spironucleus salmonicida]